MRSRLRTLASVVLLPGCAVLLSSAQGSGSRDAVPFIQAVLSPPPNASGWNNTPVSVTFTCAVTVTTCHAPFVFGDDGRGQTLNVTVTDVDGRTAAATVVVN